jgi:hypothetical protein
LKRHGFTTGFLRRVRRVARRYALSCYFGVVGAHGRYGAGKCRNSPLEPLQVHSYSKYREVGSDLFSTMEKLPYIHLKIYVGKNPYKNTESSQSTPRQKSLLDYSRRSECEQNE